MDPMMAAQAIASAPFLYYSPDPNAENRYHGHFTPHPGMLHQQMPVYPVVPTLPSTPVYSRPGSSCSQPMLQPRALTNVQAMAHAVSPRPISGQRPSIVLETEIREGDGYYYPSTPPLSSSSSSTIGSPNSCDMLQTPLNPMFSGLDGAQTKAVQQEEAQLEKFPNLDWSKCASPPMTPVYLHVQQPLAASNADAISIKNESFLPTELLSAQSCPSLSPSPSPYAQSVASEVTADFDFCDPRNLTVGNADSALATELSGPVSLLTGDETEPKFLASGSQSPAFAFGEAVVDGLPTFDGFSDLESEEDFVNGLVQLGEQSAPTPATSRSRASSDALSLRGDSFLCEEDSDEVDIATHFHLASLPTPSCSGSDEDMSEHKDKRRKTTKKPAMNTASGSEGTDGEHQHSGVEHTKDTEAHNSQSSSASEIGNNAAAPTPARRGRKQSLTEDPTKTFICEICNRRFRRQEHLKRHYRSLHTQDKPFACNECGKTFSRSDNLAQHSRTHGSGAIPLDLMDPLTGAVHSAYNPELMGGPVDDYAQSYGRVLFQIAAEMPGSSSDLSSEDDGSDHNGSRKRKRSE